MLKTLARYNEGWAKTKAAQNLDILKLPHVAESLARYSKEWGSSKAAQNLDILKLPYVAINLAKHSEEWPKTEASKKHEIYSLDNYKVFYYLLDNTDENGWETPHNLKIADLNVKNAYILYRKRRKTYPKVKFSKYCYFNWK